MIGTVETGSEVMGIGIGRRDYWWEGVDMEKMGAVYSAGATTQMTGTGVRCVRDCYRDTEEGI